MWDGSAERNPWVPASHQQEDSPCFQFLAHHKGCGCARGHSPHTCAQHRTIPKLCWERSAVETQGADPGPDRACQPGLSPAELPTERLLSAPYSGRYWTGGCLALPLCLTGISPSVATTVWEEDTTTDTKQSEPAGGRKWQRYTRVPACPEGHTGGGGEKQTICHLRKPLLHWSQGRAQQLKIQQSNQ